MREWRAWPLGALAAFAMLGEWIKASRLLLPPFRRTAVSLGQNCSLQFVPMMLLSPLEAGVIPLLAAQSISQRPSPVLRVRDDRL